MAYKTSAALLAAIVVMAGPAFAQETVNESVENAQQQAVDSVNEAADAAAADVQEAADDAAAAVEEAVNGTEAATDASQEAAPEEAAPEADAAAEATETGADDATDATAETSEAGETASDATSEEPAEAAEEQPAAEAPTEETAAEPADTAAETSSEPQVGAYYLKSTHGDWTLRCIKAEQGQPDPCELYQLLKDDQGNSVAEVTLIPLGQGEAAAGATIVAPLETDLVRGLGLQIDSSAPRGYPFNFCAPVGCVSRMGFDTAGLNSLKRGNVATVSLLPFGADPENPVALPMSLTGFTAAYEELEGIVAEARAQLEAEAPAAEEAPAN